MAVNQLTYAQNGLPLAIQGNEPAAYIATAPLQARDAKMPGRHSGQPGTNFVHSATADL